MQVRRIAQYARGRHYRHQHHDSVRHQEVRPNRGRAVGTRVETLSQSLEATQQATRQKGRTSSVDAKADQVGIWAKEAQSAAATANSAVAATERSKIEAVEASTKRLVYEVVISEDQGQFKFGSAALPEPVQQRMTR